MDIASLVVLVLVGVVDVVVIVIVTVDALFNACVTQVSHTS